MSGLGQYTIDKILTEYNGAGMYIALFCVAAIYLFLQSSKEEPGVRRDNYNAILYYILFLGLTVFNPLIANILLSYSMFMEVYYRYFWALPIVILVAYVCARLIDEQRKKVMQVGVCVLFILTILISGRWGNYVLPENSFKVPTNLIQIVNVIQEDASGDEIIAVFPDDYIIQVRQYDASVKLIYGRGLLSDQWAEGTKKYNDMVVDIRGMLYGYKMIPVQKLKQEVDEVNLKYIVLPPDTERAWIVEEIGGTLLADSEGYLVYRVKEETGDH